MKTFQDMGLPEALLNTLKKMKFDKPTPVQVEAIPLALKGRDVLGSAKTGTGKTAAFGIPLIVKLLSDPDGFALVITPTRELAKQIASQMELLSDRNPSIKSILLIGGDSISRQFVKLQKKPRLIVGTPGRINDHINRKSLNVKNTSFLVLDETDCMLDMGFKTQVENILKHIKTKPQTLLFSATLPKNIITISKKYLTDPARVAINTKSEPADKVKQDTLFVDKSKKYSSLLSELKERKGTVLIFMKTKYSTEKLAKKVSNEGHSAKAIHGGLKQNRRHNILEDFRKEKYRILIATDVVARGLDIPHIKHVVNYDIPQCAESYIHRIGRTARAEATGCALNFVTPTETKQWEALQRFLKTGSEKDHEQAKQKRGSGRAGGRSGGGRSGGRSSRGPSRKKQTRGSGSDSKKRSFKPKSKNRSKRPS